MLAANDIAVGLVGNEIVLSLDADGVEIADLHTSYDATSKALTITAARTSGTISPTAPTAGLAIDTNADTVTVDLTTIRGFSGIRVVGGIGVDSITIGPGGVNLAAVSRGAASQVFRIDTGVGDTDTIAVENPVVAKGSGAVSLMTQGTVTGHGIRLGAGVTTPRGRQGYAGAVTLVDDVALRAGGSISFASTIDGPGRLTLASGAAITLAGAVGDTTPLRGLTLAAARSVAVNDAFHLDGAGTAPGSSGLVIGAQVDNVVFSSAAPAGARTIAGFSGSGIRFEGGSRNSRITNVASTGNGLGLLVRPGGYAGTVISGGTFSGNVGSGVNLRGVAGITVGGAGATGNQINSNGGFGLRATGPSAGSLVLGNTIGNNALGNLNAGGPAEGGSLVVPAAPGLTVRLSSPGIAARRAETAGRYGFTLSVTIDGVSTSATGSVDTARRLLDVDVQSGPQSTEFRRLGDLIYVDARRLGATGDEWVRLDATAEGSLPAVRAVSSLLECLTPRGVIEALEFPGAVRFVGVDAHGRHFQASIDQFTATSLLPLFGMFGLPASDGPIAGGSCPVDVWVDSRGFLSRIAAAAGPVSLTVGLGDFGRPVRVAAPAAAATGGLDSASGAFLFGGGETVESASLDASSPTTASSGITVDPTVALVDGIIQGTLQATSDRGLPLSCIPVGDQYGINRGSGSRGGRLSMGTVPTTDTVDPLSYTILPYATWLDAGGSKGSEDFGVRVREVTDLDRFLTGIPLVGRIAAPVIDVLQELPVVGELLAPVIGSSVVATVTVDVASLAPGDTPLAFTTTVTSFDGVGISTNFFPAAGLAAGETASTVLAAAGLAAPGATNPYALGSDGAAAAASLGIAPLRQGGYNVVTWDPRGEFASGGVLQLDNPFFEGRDVSAILDWTAASVPARLDGPGDARVGMVGDSYGGGIQLTAAATDPRIDAIVPDTVWNSLDTALCPAGIFDTAAGSLLLASLETDGIHVNHRLAEALSGAVASGLLDNDTRALLADSGPSSLLNQLQTPTLITQRIGDPLFPLQQSLDNARRILANPYDTPIKVVWYDGGDGSTAPQQAAALRQAALVWLDTYVAGNGVAANLIPDFQWFDQAGRGYASDHLPYEQGFNDLPNVAATSAGGTLTIVPSSAGDPAAGGSIDVAVPVPEQSQIVGAPMLSFTYQGQGTSRAVFAAIVDAGSSRVIGNIVTPVPVTLDGATRTVSVDLSNIVYTWDATSSNTLILRITGSSTEFASSSSGAITISDIRLTLPNRDVPPAG